MNKVIEVIKSRRTTRKFLPEQIKKEELKTIIEAGLYAPSAHNQQSWHFTVIQDKDMLEELNRKSKEAAMATDDDYIKKMAANNKFNVFYNAPTIVIVSGDTESMMPQIDCAAGTQNMLIAAESLDVGACWNGFVSLLFNGPEAELYKERLSIPIGFTPYYAVALGYKGARATSAPERRENTVQYL